MNGSLLGDRYKIINVLGAGGMGRTYVAEDTQRPGNPKCVVKQLKPASVDPNFLVTASRLFKGEAAILEKLGKHDRIPHLLAHFERDGEFYIVQEYIDGQTLSAELPLGQRWTEAQVVDLLRDVLPILEFIHGQGVIHRDIKPDNIVRRKHDGKLVLIDFGAVKQFRVQQTTAVGKISGSVGIGTPEYMPPEQARGNPRTSSDIYALGKVAIQALTGLLPSQLREDEDGEAIWRDQAEVSDGLAAVLTTMTRHYFKHRYQSASEVLGALRDLESPNLGGSNGYTPTREVGNGRYTHTRVTGGDIPNNSRGSSSSSTQSTKSERRETSYQEGQYTSPPYERNRSSDSNKLVLAGGILLSVLIGGGMLYYSIFLKPPNPNDTPVKPTQSTTPSVKPTPTPTSSAKPTTPPPVQPTTPPTTPPPVQPTTPPPVQPTTPPPVQPTTSPPVQPTTPPPVQPTTPPPVQPTTPPIIDIPDV